MQKSIFFIVESSQIDALISLAGRILAYAAIERRAQVLFRLSGVIWLSNPANWPAPSPTLAAWLERQEFASAGDYWRMTLASAQPQLYWCASSSPNIPTGASPSSLTRFLLDAEAASVQPIWL